MYTYQYVPLAPVAFNEGTPVPATNAEEHLLLSVSCPWATGGSERKRQKQTQRHRKREREREDGKHQPCYRRHVRPNTWQVYGILRFQFYSPNTTVKISSRGPKRGLVLLGHGSTDRVHKDLITLVEVVAEGIRQGSRGRRREEDSAW